MNIKVCGITSLKQLEQLDGLNVDFAGIVFDRTSKSYAGGKFKEHEIAKADLDMKVVGVFRNATYDMVIDTTEKFALDIVQLEGEASPELCEQLSEEVEVIKSFNLSDEEGSIDEFIADYDEVCDYYLFYTDNKKADWKIISQAKIEKPFFLGGDINADDDKLLKKFKHPDFYGANLTDKFDKEPGTKDMGLVLKFMHDLK